MELTLEQLIKGLSALQVHGDKSVVVNKITADSRLAAPGVLFVAVRGTAGDGHQYVDAALQAGCPAVVVDQDFAVDDLNNSGKTIIVFEQTRNMPALLNRELYGKPDQQLKTVGITGTNGKTTVSFLVRQMFDKLAGPSGLLGTIKYDDGKQSVPAPLTTPGGPVFYHWLRRMVDNGCRSVAMELSSHALDQGRTAGLELDVAVMTNLGWDHLDYHKDIKTYLQAKAGIVDLLFNSSTGNPGTLVLNMGDPQLAGLDTKKVPVISFCVTKSDVKADLQLTNAEMGLSGTSLELDWRGQKLQVKSGLVGRFNLENLTAALAAGIALGHDPQECADVLGLVAQVPGRLERFLMPGGALAVVDYAHTHDALEAVLTTCGELSDGRLIVVFGCGGDRDQRKRPLMGEVAASSSDLTWVTSDNPRSESPEAIIDGIIAGYSSVSEPRSTKCYIEPDRKLAIEAALQYAGDQDVVIIAGKGHEDYQLVGDLRLDLDDRAIVSNWIERAKQNG